jgi:serine/threonine-protein kinase
VAWKTWGLVLAGVGIALVAGVAGSLVRTPVAPPPPAPVVRAALPLAADEVLAFAENFPLGMGRPSLALSPDGSTVAFVVVEGASTRIHVRRMADAVSAPLGGTEGGFEPFFSPDGQWLAFFTADKLKKVSLRGGEAVTLCDAATTYGGAWGEDDRIVFGAQEGSRLMRVSATGGRPEVLRSAVMLVWPQVLPGSRAILLTAAEESMLASENPDDLSLLAFFPETGETKLLLQGGSFGRYVPTGHLIYARAVPCTRCPSTPSASRSWARRRRFSTVSASRSGARPRSPAPGTERWCTCPASR